MPRPRDLAEAKAHGTPNLEEDDIERSANPADETPTTTVAEVEVPAISAEDQRRLDEAGELEAEGNDAYIDRSEELFESNVHRGPFAISKAEH